MLGSGCWVLVLGSWFAVLGLDIQTRNRPVEPRTGLHFLARSIEQRAESQVAASVAPGAEFDVASIKPTPGDRHLPETSLQASMHETIWRRERPSPGGRLRMAAVSLRLLIQTAYDVKMLQIVEGPAWVRSARYDVEAIASGVTKNDELRPMLRALLADRFKLGLRREMRTLPIFELATAKGGLRVAAMKEGECMTLGPGSPPPRLSLPPAPMPNICGWIRRVFLAPPPASVERIEGAGVSMPDLMALLSPDVDRIIVDRTGFNEKFSFQLDFASSALSADLPVDTRSAPSIFDAVKEQLGLELKPARGPVEVLVITHVERPSEN